MPTQRLVPAGHRRERGLGFTGMHGSWEAAVQNQEAKLFTELDA